MVIPVAPTAITLPRSRAMAPARATGSEEGVSAQTITASKPRPAEKARAASSASSRRTAASAPSRRASFTRAGFKSTPITRHPAARAICTVSSPSNPRPITPTDSPSAASLSRNPCNRDGAQRGESGVFQAHVLRNRRKQIYRDRGKFGVDRVPAAGAGHSIAGMKLRHSFAELDHHARRRIPKRHRLGEPLERRIHGGEHALAPRLLQNLADKIRARTRLAQQ